MPINPYRSGTETFDKSSVNFGISDVRDNTACGGITGASGSRNSERRLRGVTAGRRQPGLASDHRRRGHSVPVLQERQRQLRHSATAWCESVSGFAGAQDAAQQIRPSIFQEFCKPYAIFLFVRAARGLPPLAGRTATARPSAA